MTIKSVLIVDDDPDLLNLVSHLFQREGTHTFTASAGMEGIGKLFLHEPSLIILDVMMPEMNGFETCRRIRQISDIPIIMLTALNNEREMLQGLEAGADDFLSKPFKPSILLARARAVLRRGEQRNGSRTFKYNDGYLSIDIENHMAQIKSKRIKFTRREFRLLVYLARNAGKVLTFEQILVNVWGIEYKEATQYVHVYISHLRRKLDEDVKSPHYIVTIHGIGYIFEKQELEYTV